MIFASLFSGFGLADIGAKMAGCKLAWGIEIDPAIAEVSRQLGHQVLCQCVTDIIFRGLEKPDILWASPPCINFSAAKNKAKETKSDLYLAYGIVDAIKALQPQYFVLENVEAYKRSKSLKTIEDTLYSLGYWIDRQVLNSADFGVPQTRRRLIVRAVRGAFIQSLPPAQAWLGWYQAVEDLLPSLPETKLAQWQLDRLSAAAEKGQDIDGDLWIGGGNCSESFLQFAIDNRPTIPGIRTRKQPLPTVPADPATNGKARAILVPGGNATSFPVRQGHKPAPTVGDTERTGNRPKAILESARIVQMTPRCLARFQTLPDWYELPEKTALSCKGIGNGVPCKMSEQIVRSLIGA